MALTGKQKRILKARGQTLADGCQLGQAGISESFIAHLSDLLDRRELVKVRFTETEGAARTAQADEVGAAVGAQGGGILGRTMLLYRANESLDAKQRVLPADA